MALAADAAPHRPVRSLVDAFWRAAAYCLHPRVIGLSMLPLVLMGGAALALGWFWWEPAVDAVRQQAEAWQLSAALMQWMDSVGLQALRTAIAPLVVVFLATPVIVIASLIAVAWLMAPAMVSLVAERRFPTLERRGGGSMLGSLAVTVGAGLVALVALAASVPLWFIPPLVLVLPPLIWGWLTCKVLSYDVLAAHASREERRLLLREHRGPLLAMGVLAGFLGAAPSLVWASGVFFLALAPVLVPAAIWIYTLVFGFSALWFAHYLLAALQRHRAAQAHPEPFAAGAAGGRGPGPSPVIVPTEVLPAPPARSAAPGSAGHDLRDFGRLPPPDPPSS